MAKKDIHDDKLTLGRVRRDIADSLKTKYGEREASAMARVIMTTLKGWSLTELLANEDREASEFIKNSARDIVAQLMEDVPLQYALGKTSFFGLSLKVGPGVLIHRPETEELVDLIVKENQSPDLKVIDLCTGSGAIAIALARNLPFADVSAVDISQKAIEIAKENGDELKVKLNLEKEDIFKLDIEGENFDIMVSNPPYVDESEKSTMEANVLKYEPHEAIFVKDDDPLLFYRRILELAKSGVKEGGKLYLEINPRHSQELKRMMEDNGFEEVRIVKDVHGADRFATATV